MRAHARTATIGVIAGLLILTASAASAADQGSLARRCPAYTQHLEVAKAKIASADRTGAIEELRRAQEALTGCVQLEAEIQGLPTMLATAPGAKEKA